MHQINKCLGTAHTDKRKIFFPCILSVMQKQGEKLQCNRLRQTIVNIIKWVQVNVQLALSASAASIKGQAGEIDIRPVLFFETCPDGIALIRGHLWLRIDKFLEMIHHRAIWNE